MPEMLTEGDLLDRARAIAPVVAERAQECIELRRLPPQTEKEFHQAGFYKCLQPKRYGGLEFDYGFHTELGMEVGKGCASSGSDYCQAAIVQVPMDLGNGVEPCFVALPREDYEVIDTWYANGLSGTGSNDLLIEHAFIPAHRILPVFQTRGGPTPGSTSNDSHIYRIPMYAAFAFNLIGPAIGAAKGALASVADGLAERATLTGANLAQLQSAQIRIADATARLESAWSTLLPIREEINRDAKNGVVPDIQRRVHYRLMVAYVGRLCVEAVEQLFPLMGGRGLAKGNPVERAWRDVHAIVQHIGLTWDVHAGAYGTVRLGGDCPDPKV